MGRVKLAIKKLEHTNNRQITYSKRRCGILKKARELSILCDIDIFLIMFSPTGKPTICLGERSNMEDVIARFSELTPQERSKRKLESLEALKKTFKKLNHDVNIEDFLGVSSHTMEELQNELRRLQSQLSDVQEKLWYYGNETEQITSLDQARDMEETIQESLTRLHIHKETLKNNQLMALAQAGQQLYHNSICLPPAIEGTHQQQPISAWLSNHEGQQVLVQEDPNFVLPHRDVNCVADTSLSMPSGYNVLNCRQADMEAGSSSQPETFSNEFNTCGLRLQLGGQSSSYLQHHQYPQNSVTEGKKFKSDMDTSLHATASVDYGTPNIEPISAGYDGLAHQWPSSSNHHAVMSLFDKYSFPQQESLAMIEPASTSICHQIDSSRQLEHSPQSQTHITSECHMGISGLVSLL